MAMMLTLLRRFRADEGGNFAIMGAILTSFPETILACFDRRAGVSCDLERRSHGEPLRPAPLEPEFEPTASPYGMER